VIDVLLTPLRLPARALENLDALVEAGRRLPALEEAVASHLRALDELVRNISEDVGATRAELQRIGGQVDDVARTVGQLVAGVATLEPGMPRLEDEVARTRRLLEGVKGDLQDLSEHLPDRDPPGPLARAREAITGDG
jgi:hypothetical protein